MGSPAENVAVANKVTKAKFLLLEFIALTLTFLLIKRCPKGIEIEDEDKEGKQCSYLLGIPSRTRGQFGGLGV